MHIQDKIEEYISSTHQWEKSLRFLRKIILSTQLEETVKWGGPIYTYTGKNLVGMLAFKNYVAIWFYQGVMLQDKDKKLINAQEGKTKAMRQWRFNSLEEVKQDRELIKAYIEEAILNQAQGKIFKLGKKTMISIPAELADYFSTHPKLKKKFDELTPGQQKLYFEHIHEAKRVATKLKRIDKIIPLIQEGKGLHDHYKK